jgi:hypothetical protein
MTLTWKVNAVVPVAIGLVSILLTFRSMSAQGRLEVIAESGDPSPDGNGHLSSFVYRGNSQFPNFIHEYRAPVVNDRGEVAFWAAMADTTGAYSADTTLIVGARDRLHVAARIGQPLANGSTILGQLVQPQIDAGGGTWFTTTISGAPIDVQPYIGLIHANGAGSDLVFHTPTPSPDGNGTVQWMSGPTANGNGAVAFLASSIDGSQNYNAAIQVFEAGELHQVARTRQTMSGIGQFSSFGYPMINGSGQTAFYAVAQGAVGLYSAGGGAIRQVARVGLPAVNGGGGLDYLGGAAQDYQPALNNAGQVAFSGVAGGHSGLFINSGNSTEEIIGTGVPATDGNGIVAGVSLMGIQRLRPDGNSGYF